MKHLVLATNNQKKASELRRALKDLGIQVHMPDELGLPIVNPQENGVSYRENAVIKACATLEAYHKTLMSTLDGAAAYLGEDSGIEVDALPGILGVTSNRWFDGTDAERNAELLRRLKGVERLHRTARFRCVLVVVFWESEARRRKFFAKGNCKLLIADQPRGQSGFGYDPITIPVDGWGAPIYTSHETGEGMTMAEISAEQKDGISHRARAMAELRKHLIIWTES